MAFTLAAFDIRLSNLIDAQTVELSTDERYQLIKAAVAQYSNDLPSITTGEVTGTGSKFYPLTGTGAVLNGWSDDFSQVTAIEYPAAVIADNDMPQYLTPTDWRDDYEAVVSGTVVRYLYLPNHAPATTETMRINYSAPYAWTASTTLISVTQSNTFATGSLIRLNGSTYEASDTENATHIVATATGAGFTAYLLQCSPPAAHFNPICYLAASLCCRAIATKYSRTSDSTIAADAVNHPSRAAEFRQRADEWYKRYMVALGLDKSSDAQSVAGSAAWADWSTAPAYPAGRQYLFHK